MKNSRLLDIVKHYQDNHQFIFDWDAEESMMDVTHNKRWLHFCPAQTEIIISALGVTEVDAFVNLLTHELGHVEAFIRDLDWADEVLAWEFAEQMLHDYIPETWQEMVQWQLNTPAYRWYTRRQVTTDEDKFFHQLTKGCPGCRSNVQNVHYSPLVEYDDRINDAAIKCLNCSRQYRLRFKDEIFTQMWELDPRDYF